jgi:hypothetical protein
VALSDDLFWLGGYFFFFSRPISFSDVHRRAARGCERWVLSGARVCVWHRQWNIEKRWARAFQRHRGP